MTAAPPSATPESASSVGTAGRSQRLAGPARVRLLALTTAIAALALAVPQAGLGPLDAPIELRWWVIAPLVYVAELMVVHLRYRKEAHSFSLSEIPVVIGLFFVAPSELLLAVILANVAVLTIHRRQPALKLLFNIAQFALVTTIAIAVFRPIVALGSPLGIAGGAAALAATLIGVTVAVLLIGVAIALMGGALDRTSTLVVTAMSAGGALVNTALALIGVNLLWLNPEAAWLALVPAAVVYLAYKAYVSQIAERSRLKAMYEATLDLHGAPRIEEALLIAADHARSMVDAETAHVVVFSGANPSMAFRTTTCLDREPVSMRETRIDLDSFPWGDVAASRSSIRFDVEPDRFMPSVDTMNDGIVVPLVSRDDECLGLLVAANRLGDISAFEHADVELLETLASRVTVTLENGELENSLNELTVLKDRLEATAASKDEFIASISHELRTPLTAVVGLSQELTMNGHLFDPIEYEDFIQLIAQQSLELSNIVDDLLVAARADSGTLQLEVGLVDLSDAVALAVQAQYAQSNQTAPPISLSRRGDVFAWADPLRVRQIVRNLLQNADRYGGEDVRVAIERQGVQPMVIVSDDGPGVPVGSEETIFAAYERAHGEAAQPASVGLGLSVARQLARLMGGDLEYRRRDERTEFVLTLPSPGRTRTMVSPRHTIDVR